MDKNNELDFSESIRAQLREVEGTEEEITQEAWAAEEKSGKKLNKPFRTPKGPKKFSVYVKNEKGNVVKVNFGDPNMEIKRDSPERRKSFRARHNCANPGPKTKARYWSCKMWSQKSVKNVTSSAESSEQELLEELDESESKQGLWDNIRKKKKREGKNYRPAKPGDKDRPKKDAWEKAQKPKEEKSKAEDDKNSKDKGLTEEQKKLPDAVKKSILEKKQKSKADEKAGYPPNCNEGYVEKDGKCVPVSDSGYKKKKK